MKLLSDDIKILKSFGYLTEDIEQIRDAAKAKYTTLTCDDIKISHEAAAAILGQELYLSGIARSAFHRTALRESERGKKVLFITKW